MAMRIATNPNRMELLKLRRRLGIARRGHKLLKDKFDELMKPFLAMIKEVRDLRLAVESELCAAHQVFALARSEVSTKEIEESLLYPKASADVEVIRENLVSVRVPRFGLMTEGPYDSYGLGLTPSALDEALARFSDVLPKMVLLAQEENTIKLLASEIEKTRRRVNALEYVLIPQLEETIRYITIRLDEFERANLTRLMKIKEIVS
jgi:V/A-type H+-transporting ATPase subunit D